MAPELLQSRHGTVQPSRNRKASLPQRGQPGPVDSGSGFIRDLASQWMIKALLFLEQTAVTPLTGLNIHFWKTRQFQYMGNRNLPADFLDDEFAIARRTG
jgi:hypothetical protein